MDPNISELTESTSILKIKKDSTQINVLHVGRMIVPLKIYLIKNNIQHYPVTLPLVNKDVDFILVNDNNTAKNTLPRSLVNLRPIVRYKNAKHVQAHTNVIPFILVPILVQYLIKLKESLSQMSRRKAFDNADQFLQVLTSTIDDHLDDHTLSIKKLSKMVFMSRSAFSKKIKKITGLKPTEFINHYKLEKSKHLLSVTNWQIGRISDHLGFCSQQYYCRLFKKKEGVNPTEFRKEYRNRLS